MENEDECMFYIPSMMVTSSDMIHEFTPITNTFVSVPADMGQLNCAAYLAGMIAGMLDSAKFVRLAERCNLVVTCCRMRK